MTRTSVRTLRRVARAEGVSFLLLLGVAMPLKYLAGWPAGVTVVGWVHGALFIAFCAVLAWVFFRCRWPISRAALVFLAAWVPFGPFLIDRRMGGWGDEAAMPDTDRGATGPAVDPAQG